VHVPVKPFWGVIGVAPPLSMGRMPSGPPNIFGGNLDNRDLGAAARCFCLSTYPGGCCSFGDGHAAQGHGEVCLSAIETSLRGEVQILSAQGTSLRWPRAGNADALHHDGAGRRSRRAPRRSQREKCST
jgi:acetamidase/formamidase